MSIVTKRSEILFCYDVTDANPNGDPMDENKPRIDVETKINIVTDVRFKRTIRDYLYEYKGYNGQNGKDVFVREILLDDSNPEKGIQDGKTRAKDYNNDSENVLKECIDIRLFGGVIPLDKDSITFTGPVQFKMGRSLHKVEIKHIKGTGAFAAKLGSKQATFREEYILPYSFICFHGIINEAAAKYTKLAEEDISELLEAMWNGTKNLISRSKFGQMPRFLLKVTYKEPGFFIGDLDKKLKLTDFENEFAIRSPKDFKLDISGIINVIEENKNHIEKIEYKIDESLKITPEIPQGWEILKI
ncbi:type I-B CRISPR-associated protein Cas7/Csh2 [Deferribacterales bacterium Es71-Z0220]|uniref:type I-B CRISPR-associated protein Cas7/Csh2 n=1 Tax=Deferrivibrio essentukiensis TaxID=2880922 RepID=UPI001F5FFFEF|nr:type I-B CRISPR-associated protein Cas7/Csh2 [Deferrivibrio essentukiensis]MCB4205478.1 type I-B CRISPR-associated protein Cas7/Csh2 [Deferrivibrio essentukiensis]